MNTDLVRFKIECNNCNKSYCSREYNRKVVLKKLEETSQCPYCSKVHNFIPLKRNIVDNDFLKLSDNELLDLYFDNEYCDLGWSKELNDEIMIEITRRNIRLEHNK